MARIKLICKRYLIPYPPVENPVHAWIDSMSVPPESLGIALMPLWFIFKEITHFYKSNIYMDVFIIMSSHCNSIIKGMTLLI